LVKRSIPSKSGEPDWQTGARHSREHKLDVVVVFVVVLIEVVEVLKFVLVEVFVVVKRVPHPSQTT
jgi:hypothetical protein